MESLTSTNDLGTGPLDVDQGDWLEDTAPGTARLAALAEADVVIATDVAAYISTALNSMQTRFPAIFQTSFSTLDPLVVELLMNDLKQ